MAAEDWENHYAENDGFYVDEVVLDLENENDVFLAAGFVEVDDESHYNSHPQSGYVSDFVSSWEKGFVS